MLLQGCLAPIQVIIPSNSLLDPSESAAVVGGNVLTSQRIVDTIFQAFQICAASQGCMNNITIGDSKFGYYETVAGGSGAVSIVLQMRRFISTIFLLFFKGPNMVRY